ncbi:MAG: 23S rRNA (adenine(2503)-C(2))-methyltransferase RlmN [Hymenobacteraceae bacterium]|nr:23S rRNA (adenine(2503)-C(2))-methyltransferase RlmN [Hymenobacteraceae bacterium]
MPDYTSKVDIRKLSLDGLTEFLLTHGEKKFRAQQVYEWLWKRSAQAFDQMTNLSLATRELLAQHFDIRPVVVQKAQQSIDGTIKSAFRLWDGNVVEGVLIPKDDRMTACVSSQVGCSLTCKFCATGYMERKRNLDAAEIYDQVVLINQQALASFGLPLTNVVYMGMGEPLLNYANVVESVNRLTDQKYGLGMAARRLTISTAGIAKMIRKLADDGVRANLALSLHAANDTKRNEIMPINETNSLAVITEAIQHYRRTTERDVTYEYIALDRFNDSVEDAADLVKFVRTVPGKVNIIEYNPIAAALFNSSADDRVLHFHKYLADRGIQTNIRRSRGKDIDAACGQLAGKEEEAQAVPAA